MKRTIAVKRNWWAFLQENSDASSTEGGSLACLRRSIWGNDAYVVRCCKHLFRVDKMVFDYLSANS